MLVFEDHVTEIASLYMHLILPEYRLCKDYFYCKYRCVYNLIRTKRFFWAQKYTFGTICYILRNENISLLLYRVKTNHNNIIFIWKTPWLKSLVSFWWYNYTLYAGNPLLIKTREVCSFVIDKSCMSLCSRHTKSFPHKINDTSCCLSSFIILPRWLLKYF